ncbi:hypothetical protein M0R45_009182 [Rubus argutus]|uniref:Uncharacterized protein n=1 Tax=Rubus argutus TaxID=59490 RepID=A0AAW1Y483_RUBAR
MGCADAIKKNTGRIANKREKLVIFSLKSSHHLAIPVALHHRPSHRTAGIYPRRRRNLICPRRHQDAQSSALAVATIQP